VAAGEMLDTFNCGLGMVVALPAADVPQALATVATAGLQATVVGRVVAAQAGAAAVRYEGALAL
jgi:phosphoribosylformylglycinamidine cyclo-ligase